MRAVEIRLGGALVLTAPEAEALGKQVAAGWRHPTLEAVEGGQTPGHLFDAYELFDISIRDAIDELWKTTGSWDEAPDYRLIELALDRIVEAHPTLLDEIFGAEARPGDRP